MSFEEAATKPCAKCKVNPRNAIVKGKPYPYCRECRNKVNGEWRRAHPESANARNRAYRASSPENTERMRACERRWRERNPEAVRALRHNSTVRRQRKVKEAGPGFTSRQWRQVIESQNGACNHCGRFVGKALTIDHIVPLARGGRHAIENIQGLCSFCNASKGAKLERELQAAGKIPPRSAAKRKDRPKEQVGFVFAS